MNLIILGPQGSGKGTQAKLLADKFGLRHISTGALLREESQNGTQKGNLIADILKSGELVPFETVLDVLEPAIIGAKQGFILDGTPRNLSQAEYLTSFLNERHTNIDHVIVLNIPRDESIKRLVKRAEIEHRPDDNPTSINERLEIYEHDTVPVIDYYRKEGKIITIDGTPDIDTIFRDILTHLT